jgi:hypothetical protein
MAFVILAALIGLLPAYIAYRKGERFLPWWVFGAALFIVALPISAHSTHRDQSVHAIVITGTTAS